MQIVIPMSGYGERFRRAGYKVPKPLIQVEGRPIISHVIDLFPGETNFTFICSLDHLNDSALELESTLRRLCPEAKVLGIPSHKLGPIHAVQQIEKHLSPDEPVVVNYCDFSCYWSWANFKAFVRSSRCEGAIPAYRGFHPHSLGTTNYAYLKETNGWVSDIQEKQPFTSQRMNEFASSGTYYFSSARLMSKAFATVIENNWNVGGEFYVSLAYKALIEGGHSTAVYELQHFMQWGTPEDVAEYNFWSAAFRSILSEKTNDLPRRGSVIIPMAGTGQRFVDEGYKTPKPLIQVSGQAMVLQATDDLPAAKKSVFVLRDEADRDRGVESKLACEFPDSSFVRLQQTTDGQARTTLLGLHKLLQSNEASGPVTVGACDNGAVYSKEKLQALLDDPDTDVIVWGATGYPNAQRRPEMYGWIESDDDNVVRISVKQPLAHPREDPIVIGTFTFKDPLQLENAINRLIERKGLVNGEYYLDSCINDALELGLKCKLFLVDSYLCWGTPNDFKTFEYWQSCFHKWKAHPYSLALDANVPAESVAQLHQKTADFEPYRPTNPFPSKSERQP